MQWRRRDRSEHAPRLSPACWSGARQRRDTEPQGLGPRVDVVAPGRRRRRRRSHWSEEQTAPSRQVLTTMTRLVHQDRCLRGPARVGLWLLPAYGLLLALSTTTHQPSVETDFA